MAMYWAIIGVLADSDMPGSLEIRKTGGKDAGEREETYLKFAFREEGCEKKLESGNSTLRKRKKPLLLGRDLCPKGPHANEKAIEAASSSWRTPWKGVPA